MNNFQIDICADRIISEQWDSNAKFRFEELNSGRDKTYTHILCPVLYKLVKKMSGGHSVIDVGCGLGFFSDYLHQRGFNVTGIDMSSQSISLGKDKFPYLSLHSESIINFSKRKRGSYDVSIANMLFHNVPNVEEVAKAFFDLLKSNGVLIGCIPHPVHWFEHRRHKAERVSISGKHAYLTPFQIKGSSAHPSPFTYFHREFDEYLRIFTRAGFSEIHAGFFEGISGIPDDLIFFVAKKI